ncbi:site-specific DNA-methyltransferase [Clostridium estertheticum]|uniref:DNA-methyltransferase n=1 Tax=Clostridium estertheticum TaxID=238834 RepID=UPI001C7D8687|nr:site-specific DNA-methyltransferase [Clostridium estertheticum]MBX4261547.1 site-specific DNA-methyltransferase [Clostridium estertheticum]WLC70951.1 site-specific DNA-methyltransferase [Clostridium estertheticum]
MKTSEGLVKGCSWKVYRGNCLDIVKSMANRNELVDCIVTSPPYFDRRSYGVKPKSDGNIAKWLYASSGKPIADEIGNCKDKDKYIKDIKSVLEICFNVLKEGKFMFVNISTSHNNFELLDFSSDFIECAKSAGFVHWDTIIWIKRNPMPAGKHKKIYLSQGWEYILAFSKGKGIEINNEDIKIETHFKCENCQKDNYIKSDTTPNYVYSNIGCYGRKYNSLISHPALFPIDIPSYCLSIATKQGEIILDPFVGSGTTLIAGLELGLNVIGCELVSEIYEGLVKGMQNISL